MNSSKYVTFILIGFVLVLLGAVLPFLMVLHYLESTFFLNFFAYGASMVGLILGLIGASQYVNEHRRKN
jgi:hypothetical protein